MKPIKLLSLLALVSSISANATIIFPGENGYTPTTPGNSSTPSEITFPTFSKTPLDLYNGYTIKDGVFQSNVNTCEVIIDNPEYEAKIIWEGKTPKLMIVGNTNPFPCRALLTTNMELDLTQFLDNVPAHILEQLELANRVIMLRNY
ncbi:hypothetical protein F0315_12025 [Vibrio cholerae]|nr:hypothetical protein F0315_12025 [Vibrio cholerae]